MKPKRLKLVNYCQFGNREFDLSGLTVVTGPNGVGKTNILSAICYCMYGESPFRGVGVFGTSTG